MITAKKLHLGAFMRPASIHSAAWRYPGAYADANFNFKHHQYFARKLEAGCFDFYFMADHLAVLNMPIEALRRSATVTSFEPLTFVVGLIRDYRTVGAGGHPARRATTSRTMWRAGSPR